MSKHTLLRIRLLLTAFMLLGVIFAAPTSNAADEQTNEEDILLSPTKKRYELNAGETKQDTIKIVNSGSRKISFIVYARPYSVINENYDPNYDSNFKNADAYKWVQFKTGTYNLEPNEFVDIDYTIRVPQNAAPGGHYGVLFAETQATERPTGTAILQKKRIGAVMYATVKGKTQLSGKFLGTDVPTFQYAAPLKIRQRIENTGNTDFLVKGTTTVTDVFGGLKFKNEKESAVLPNTIRAIDNDWVNPAWIGLYKVTQSASFLDTKKSTSGYVLFIPVWVYLTVVLLVGARVLYAVVHRNRKK